HSRPDDARCDVNPAVRDGGEAAPRESFICADAANQAEVLGFLDVHAVENARSRDADRYGDCGRGAGSVPQSMDEEEDSSVGCLCAIARKQGRADESARIGAVRAMA